MRSQSLHGGTPEELTEYSLGALLVPTPDQPEPDDFDRFWQSTFEDFGTSAVAWRTVRELDATPTHRVTEIRFESSADEPAAAFVMEPHATTAVRRGLVVGHGYGGRTGPDADRVPADTVAVFPCAPGTNAEAPSRFPALPAEHVLAGIAHRDTYSLRFAAADIWRAATVLLDMSAPAADALDFSGSSFGGGIGAMALPWDTRFRRATLDVPSFGAHEIRLTRRCTGSGEAVRRHLRTHPEARATLDYHDAATAARRLRIPTHVVAALLDPAVDPRGQFAVYHALAGPRRLTVRANGHIEGPEGQRADALARQAAMDFLALPAERLQDGRAGAL